jgi:hypothetical protein
VDVYPAKDCLTDSPCLSSRLTEASAAIALLASLYDECLTVSPVLTVAGSLGGQTSLPVGIPGCMEGIVRGKVYLSFSETDRYKRIKNKDFRRLTGCLTHRKRGETVRQQVDASFSGQTRSGFFVRSSVEGARRVRESLRVAGQVRGSGSTENVDRDSSMSQNSSSRLGWDVLLVGLEWSVKNAGVDGRGNCR